MRHRVKKVKLSRHAEHRNMLIRNLVTALLKHERITTTEAKAKAMRPWVDKVINWAKKGDLSSKRRVFAYLTEKQVAYKLIKEAPERYADRSSGFTRMYRLGPRRGDNAEMALVELVDAKVEAQEEA
jgi:large subunit ribosomal protein L17